jgi:hypothetical protein
MRQLVNAGVVTMLVLAANTARADEPTTAGGTHSNGAANEGSGAQPSPRAAKKDRAACETDASDDDCSCDARCCRSHRGCHDPSVSLSVAGVRPSITHVSAGGTSANDLGVAVAGRVDSYALDGTTHAAGQFVLGGGQAGFEGLLAGVIDIGYRLDVTEKQGPFTRAGFDGRIQGNDDIYFSALELPRMTLGWQYLSGKTVLEIGGRGGPMLSGRFNPAGGYRSTSGSWEYGGFAAAQVEFLRLEATALRIDARKTGDHSPVDVGRGLLCGVAGRLGVCGDFMLLRGTADMGATVTPGVVNNQHAVASYMGVTVGFASW